MTITCRLALLGLAPVDRMLIEPLFVRNPAGSTACELVHDLTHADLIIVNADDANTVRELRARKLPAVVLLLGDSDAGTGWPVLSRPVQLPAVLQAVMQLMPPGRSGVAPQTLRPATAAIAPATEAVSTRRRTPNFEATVPFAPLEMPGASGAAAYGGFDVTQPFEQAASGALVSRPLPPGPLVADDPIDLQSLLMWRDAQATPPSRPGGGASAARAAKPVGAVTDIANAAESGPGLAGHPDREHTLAPNRAVEQPVNALAPEDWRKLAQQQALAQRLPAQPETRQAENLSSSFSDPADHPTLPPAFAAAGQQTGILLIGEERLAQSSLIRALRGFGCMVDYVPDGEVALSRLASQAYSFAFLDALSLRRQTLPLCRALRRRARALGQQNLRVVVIARKGDPLRRLLAWLAGCDAWMTLPLERRRLGQYLRDKA